MITFHQAIFAINPLVVTVRGDVAYDKDENIIEYDKAAAQTKFEEMQANESNTRQSALNKLMALGLTEEEALALGVK